MKTAISIPDDIYEAGEALAEQLHTSRSQLYTKALQSYMKRHKKDITEQLNEVYQGIDSRMDLAWLEAQSHVFKKEVW